MGNIVSSIVVAIVTAICTVLGTLYVQKRKNESAVRKCALCLYLNLKQTKGAIDKDKKTIDQISMDIVFMPYFSELDYIGLLSELKDKLNDKEIESVNHFYETVKKLDNYKMNFGNTYNMYYSYPVMPNPYEYQYQNNLNAFTSNLNAVTNSDEYKSDIVEVISKLRELKDKKLKKRLNSI
jgi:hypothetical protein|nr:hypothetical protein [uncultured Acetatifactor sp.]